jgi:DNA-binding CsgD family transcriptional regulator
LYVVKTPLKDADYLLLLSCVESIHDCHRLEDFPRHVLRQLRKLIDCRLACYAEIDFSRKRALNVFDPPLGFDPPTDNWMKSIHDHPVLNYFKSTGDGQALKISDFLSATDYHRLDVYRDVYKSTGAEDQMGFGVQVESRFVLGFAFDRADRSFTERDRVMLNLIRPHIIQAYLHLEELAGHEELQRDLQTALCENGLGVIVLRGRNRIFHATPGVLDKLAGYFAVPLGTSKLPPTLARWAFSDGKEESLVVNRAADRLKIRRLRPSDDRLLLFISEESHETAAAERLAQFRLTRREKEVLVWLAKVKSNAEIAKHLGVSPATIKVHVERLLAKLGVKNRGAAAAVLRGVDV